MWAAPRRSARFCSRCRVVDLGSFKHGLKSDGWCCPWTKTNAPHAWPHFVRSNRRRRRRRQRHECLVTLPSNWVQMRLCHALTLSDRMDVDRMPGVWSSHGSDTTHTHWHCTVSMGWDWVQCVINNDNCYAAVVQLGNLSRGVPLFDVIIDEWANPSNAVRERYMLSTLNVNRNKPKFIIQQCGWYLLN